MDQESSELIELLLCQSLARQDEEGPGVVAKVCVDHEHLIPEVQRLLGILAGLGLDGRDSETPRADPVGSPSVNGVQERLGEFRLIRLLGRGGMGAVYLAEDQELKRKVALKVIRCDFLQEEKARSRFKRETDALARLDHPGLCTIYRAGEDGGLPWISMRYVEGETLEQVLAHRRQAPAKGEDGSEGVDTGSGSVRRGRRDLSECLVLFEKVAISLQSAHEAGLVHRDLKPGNIMIPPEGEPVVLDFGLARDDASDQQLTLSGEQLGTPAYMSPEQVRGGDIDARSDIYSLGVTLFEALTLELPYESRGREELFQAIVKGRRRKVSQVRRGLPPEMQIVIDKAMDPDPERRYSSMKAFAEDLRCVREHQPIQARRSGVHLRLRRWTQRNPVAATFLVLMGLGLGVSLFLLERGNDALRRSLARGYANLAATLMDDKPLHAVELALRSVEMEPDPESFGRLDEALQRAHGATIYSPEADELEGFEVKSVLRSPAEDEDRYLLLPMGAASAVVDPILFFGNEAKRLRTQGGGAYDGCWSPDGSCFITTSRGPVARVWSKSGEPIEQIKIPGTLPKVRVAMARFFPDGDRILFSCNDGILRTYSRSRKEWLREYPSKLCRANPKKPRPITALDLDPGGSYCVLGSRAQGVEYVDLQTGTSSIFIRTGSKTGMENAGSPVAEVSISSDGRHVCVQWYSGIVALWTRQGTLIRTWGLEGNRCRGEFSPDGRRLLTAHLYKVARIWDLGEGNKPGLTQRSVLGGHPGWVTRGRFSTDGRMVLTCCSDGVVRIWDTDTNLEITRLSGSSTMVRDAVFDRSGNSCLLGGDANRLRLFQLSSPNLPLLKPQLSGARSSLELPGSWPGRLVTRAADSTLAFYSETGELTKSVRENLTMGDSLVLSQDGKWLAYTMFDGRITILSPSGQVVAKFATGQSSPMLRFGPRDTLFAFENPDQGEQGFAVYCLDDKKGWQMVEKEILSAHRERFGVIWTMTYDKQYQLLAVARWDGRIDIFDCAREELRFLRSLSTRGLSISQIAFSPDGQRILAGTSDTTAKLWSIEGKLMTMLSGHAGRIVSVSFSSDGERMLTATPRTGARIWDREGHHLLSLKPRRGALTHANFLSDGNRVLISSTDGTTRVAWADRKLLLEEAQGIEKTVTDDLWADYDRLVGK